MAIYHIPTQDIEGFKIILNLSNKLIDKINSKIELSQSVLSPSQLAERLSAETSLNEEDCRKILKIIHSLSTLRKDDDLSKQDIVSEIIDSLKELDEEPFKLEKNWKQLEKNLTLLLSNEEKISLGFKSIHLSWEFDKIYMESKIMTDIRPVFEEEIDKNINSGIIVHSLKIEYHLSNDTHQKIFIKLDSDDLKELKEQIIRAEKKEQKIKESLKDYFKIINTLK